MFAATYTPQARMHSFRSVKVLATFSANRESGTAHGHAWSFDYVTWRSAPGGP